MTSWQEATQRIIDNLDVLAEYRALGVKPAQSEPDSGGWIPVHAIGRVDHVASAAINVKTGRYKDHGCGPLDNVSMFDAAAFVMGVDWREARKHFADRAGVEVKEHVSDGNKRPRDKFLFRSGEFHMRAAVELARAKPGISPKAIQLCGGRRAEWPVGRPEKFGPMEQVWSFPSWKPFGTEWEPTGYHSISTCGQPVKIVDNEVKTWQSGPAGLIGQWAVDHWEAAEEVWVCEGLSDLLCLQRLLGERTDAVAVTMGGAKTSPGSGLAERFRGKKVRLALDPDEAGERGVAIWAKAVGKIADEVKRVKMDKDLRDFVLAGGDPLAADADDVDVAAAVSGSLPEGVICNWVPGSDPVVALSSGEIMAHADEVTGGWPRRVEGDLFVDENGKVSWISKVDDLFAYYHRTARVDWKSHDRCMTKAEFLSGLRVCSQEFESIHDRPHFPPMERVYYSCSSYEPGDGSAVEEMVAQFFNCSTAIDEKLVEACIYTLFWGGPTGQRPAFLFTSKEGQVTRGIGKTVTAQAISRIAGKYLEFQHGASPESIRKRMLTLKSATQRVCFIDNIKSDRYSWADFESLVTADVISGHRLYRGEANIPNYFTWLLTINGPGLVTDISQRIIPILLDRFRVAEGKEWIIEVKRFERDRGRAVIEDAKAFFDREVESFVPDIRWNHWARQILGRMGGCGQVLCDEILRRQGKYDVEVEEFEAIEHEFELAIRQAGGNELSENVFFTSREACEIYNRATNDRKKVTGSTRQIKQGIDEGRILSLTYGRLCKSGPRGFIWKNSEKSRTLYSDMNLPTNGKLKQVSNLSIF